MLSTVRMRIEPDAAQREFIDETLKIHCYVYNGMLTAVNLFFGMYGRLPSENDLNRVGTRIWQNTPCFRGIYQNTMNCISKRVLHAYKCCNGSIRRVDKIVDEDGHESGTLALTKPREKHLRRYRSFTYLSNKAFSLVTYETGSGRQRRGLKLGKMPGILRCYNQSTPIDGTPKMCTISKVDHGTHAKYFASITYE